MLACHGVAPAPLRPPLLWQMSRFSTSATAATAVTVQSHCSRDVSQKRGHGKCASTQVRGTLDLSTGTSICFAISITLPKRRDPSSAPCPPPTPLNYQGCDCSRMQSQLATAVATAVRGGGLARKRPNYICCALAQLIFVILHVVFTRRETL